MNNFWMQQPPDAAEEEGEITMKGFAEHEDHGRSEEVVVGNESFHVVEPSGPLVGSSWGGYSLIEFDDDFSEDGEEGGSTGLGEGEEVGGQTTKTGVVYDDLGLCVYFSDGHHVEGGS